MPAPWGRDHSKADLRRRVGRLDQVAGIRLATIGDGSGRGVRLLESTAGSGSSFERLGDRPHPVPA